MARKTKADTLAAIHEEALTRFSDLQSVTQSERTQCVEDRRFVSIPGAQWEGPWGDQFENKPRPEVNKVQLSVIRIINEYRNNRIDVEFIPKDGDAGDATADACADLYRADCEDSCADEAYDNAFEEAVWGGFGAFRLRNEYEDEHDPDNDRQRVRIDPIFDADSTVFFDLNAQKQDKSDAKFCFLLTPMTRAAYIDQYDDDPSAWPRNSHATSFDWVQADYVYLAEYYRVEEKRETWLTFVDVAGVEAKIREVDLTDDKLDELASVGAAEVARRSIKTRKVRKYVMSGGKVLSDDGYIAGKCIPVIPVYGKRWYVDGIERYSGHVRLQKDAQRLLNMQLSRLAEIGSKSSTAKPIFTPEQISGHEYLWSEDGVQDYPFLLINALTDTAGNPVLSGPVGETRPPEIPPALAALLQFTDQALVDLSGNQQAGEEMQQNMSGKAVELIQSRLDMQSFIYMSNFAKAVRRAGEVWLSMAADVYVEPSRKMKGVRADGAKTTVEINKPVMDLDTGESYSEVDLSDAKYDVAVDVGPASSSRRAAVVRALTGMMGLTADPETQAVLGAYALMNMEGEGLKDLRDWNRKKLVKMGVVEPTKDEAKQMQEAAQNVQPDPNAQLAASLANEADAKAMKAQADTQYAIAKTQEAKANALETLAGIDNARQEQVLKTADTLNRITSAAQPPGVMGEMR